MPRNMHLIMNYGTFIEGGWPVRMQQAIFCPPLSLSQKYALVCKLYPTCCNCSQISIDPLMGSIGRAVRPSQSRRKHGKTPIPTLKDRVIVFDCKAKTLEVKSRREVDESKFISLH